MSKYQDKYDREKREARREITSEIQEQINDLKEQIRNTDNPDMKDGLQSRLDALEIKLKSYKEGDPVKESEVDEEAQGAVTTGSVGSPTISTSDGGSAPAPHGSSHIYAPKIGGMATRKGDIKRKKKKKKKNKTRKEFVEHYFGEDKNA